MIKNIPFLLMATLLFSSCSKEEKPAIAFYYWRTIFKLSSLEKETLVNNSVQKLYIRYFDVDFDQKTNECFPLAPIHFNDKPSNFSVVPVIYIKNRVVLFNKLNIPDLVKKINDYIGQINTKNKIEIHEIQIDCDWTLASKDNYLKFIDLFKKSNKTLLSATIRLHQVKYFEKTKIPNVDKGVLMYYNMGKIAPDSLNSIYDKNLADNYLKSLKKYPLPLDVALPIFSWAIHIRNGRVIALKNKINVADLKNDANFVQKTTNNFQVLNSNYKNSTFFKKDDILKIEQISHENLLQMASDLNENFNNNPKEVIFYDLDQFNIQQYEKDIFTKVSAGF